MTEKRPDPEEQTLIRVKFRTEYEFVMERNALTSDEPHTRDEVREAIKRLTQAEKRVLDSRVRTKLADVTRLMRDDTKDFEEPQAHPSDLERDCQFDTV